MTKPIKKINSFGTNDTMTDYYCRNCGSFMTLRINHDAIIDKRKACGRCGCEIDWRGEI